nr:unnamed protein product [Callosobruchus chinensis]
MIIVHIFQYVLIMKISQLYLIVAAMPISLGHLDIIY